MLSGTIKQSIFSAGFSQGFNFKQRKGKIKTVSWLRPGNVWGRKRGNGSTGHTGGVRRDTRQHPSFCTSCWARGNGSYLLWSTHSVLLSWECSKHISVTNQNISPKIHFSWNKSSLCFPSPPATRHVISALQERSCSGGSGLGSL